MSLWKLNEFEEKLIDALEDLNSTLKETNKLIKSSAKHNKEVKP